VIVRGLYVGIAALLAGILSAPPSVSQSRDPVYFAGLAYLGDYQYVDGNYPHTRALDAEGALSRAIASAVREREPAHLELRHDLADLDRTETVVFAIAVDRERVSREVFEFRRGVQTKLIVELSLQLLFYDLARGTLVHNLPMSAAVNHAIDGRPKDVSDEARTFFRELYLGGETTQGLINRVVEHVDTLRLRAAEGLRFRLETLDLSDEVIQALPATLSREQLRQGVGQWFSARLADESGVSVIPFTRGYAMGNQLPGRFANGEAFNLRLPAPDYAMHVTLQGLTRFRQGDDKLVFGAAAHFELEEPFTQTVMIDGDFRKGIYKLASDMRVQEDDWSAYQDVIESLLDDLVTQLRSPNRDWHTTHARAPDSFRQFDSKKELFND
jgi:hypothetical protein